MYSEHEVEMECSLGAVLRGLATTVNRAASLVDMWRKGLRASGRKKGLVVPVDGRCACAVGRYWGALLREDAGEARPDLEKKEEVCWNNLGAKQRTNVQRRFIPFSTAKLRQQPVAPCKSGRPSAGLASIRWPHSRIS